MKTNLVTLSRAIVEYGEYLRHEQGASQTTRVGYQSWLRRFARFLSEQNEGDPLLSDITTEVIRDYLYSLSRQGLRPRTLRSAIYPIRGLYALALERDYCPTNPALAVKLPKKDAAIRLTVSDGELDQLLTGFDREPDPARRIMGTAVLSVLIFGGLRRQELLDLQLPDIDLAENKILVRSGKGAKSRGVYVCSPCIEALRSWIAVRPQASHPYLFITDCRRRLGDTGLSRLIETAKSMADLRDHQNISPHSIRHAAATRLLRKGADLKSIQQFLGHGHLQTTAIYLHTDEKQLQQIAGLAVLNESASSKSVKCDEETRTQPAQRTSLTRQPRTTAGRFVRQRPR